MRTDDARTILSAPISHALLSRDPAGVSPFLIYCGKIEANGSGHANTRGNDGLFSYLAPRLVRGFVLFFCSAKRLLERSGG